jgi:membrane protein YqaA with SNARE-associated domain
MTNAAATADPGFLIRAWRVLVKARGDRRWDVFLHSTGLVAALGVPVLLLFPTSATLVWLAVLALPANSPFSPLLPTFFEPIIVEAAQWEAAWVVTLVAAAGYMYMEYVNWHVYAWVLNWDRLSGFRERRSVRWGVANFGRSPFWVIVVFAFTPVPFWAARILAILYRYPLWRFMAATLIGRVPRWYCYALFGQLVRVPVWILVAVIVVPAAVVIMTRLVRGVPLLAETAPPVDDARSKT